jgi:hypothetical protein
MAINKVGWAVASLAAAAAVFAGSCPGADEPEGDRIEDTGEADEAIVDQDQTYFRLDSETAVEGEGMVEGSLYNLGNDTLAGGTLIVRRNIGRISVYL